MNSLQLKSLRLRLGMSQKKMADKLGVSKATYGRYERGEWPINSTVKKLLAIGFPLP